MAIGPISHGTLNNEIFIVAINDSLMVATPLGANVPVASPRSCSLTVTLVPPKFSVDSGTESDPLASFPLLAS